MPCSSRFKGSRRHWARSLFNSLDSDTEGFKNTDLKGIQNELHYANHYKNHVMIFFSITTQEFFL